MAHAEQLKDAEGQICLVGCDGKGTAAWYPFGGAVDQYTFRGSGGSSGGSSKGESWHPMFTYHGFQFVEISGWPASAPPPTATTLRKLVVHSDNAGLGPTPSFSNPLLSSIHGNIVRTLTSNMHSVESDCPTRERVGWTGDAQATAETAFRTLDVASFYTKWLQDLQDAQHSNGALSSTVPFAKHTPPVDPSWPTFYAQCLRLMYKYAGDLRVVERHYQNVKRYVDYMATVKTCPSCREDMNGGHATQAPNGLPWFYMNGDWMEFVPQNEELALSGPILSSYHYMLDVEIVAELAAVLGKDDDAQQYTALAKRTAAQFNNVYLTRGEQPNPSPSPKPGAKVVCGYQQELKKGGSPIALSCGRGDAGGGVSSIASITFASFGTPQGSCTSGFTVDPSCDSQTAKAKIVAACVGKAACTLSPTTGNYGDPCTGKIKHLAVQVNCTGSRPLPTPALAPALWTYGGGQTENAVPLMHKGLVPADKVQSVTATLINFLKAASNHTTTGYGIDIRSLITSFFYYRVLSLPRSDAFEPPLPFEHFTICSHECLCSASRIPRTYVDLCL